MNFEKKRRALITGASTGIGKATALAFAKAGIDVALVSRSQDKLESVAKAAQELGVEAEAFCMDLAEVSQVKSKIQGIS
ncbi:MAG: SDR family NAD(P)-dependent oxidoreductase, partial [Aphanizomenon sp.]